MARERHQHAVVHGRGLHGSDVRGVLPRATRVRRHYQGSIGGILQRRRSPCGLHPAKFVAFPDVVVFVVGRRRNHERKRVGREVVERAIVHGRQVEPVIGARKRIPLLFLAVVNHGVKTARKGDNHFVLVLEGMAPAELAAGNVVNPVTATKPERHLLLRFHDTQVPSFVEKLGKLDNLRLFFKNRHIIGLIYNFSASRTP